MIDNLTYLDNLCRSNKTSFSNNQLTNVCTTHGECILISIRCSKECLESKLDRQTDSHSDYSAYLRVVQNFDTKSLNRGSYMSAHVLLNLLNE